MIHRQYKTWKIFLVICGILFPVILPNYPLSALPPRDNSNWDSLTAKINRSRMHGDYTNALLICSEGEKAARGAKQHESVVHLLLHETLIYIFDLRSYNQADSIATIAEAYMRQHGIKQAKYIADLHFCKGSIAFRLQRQDLALREYLVSIDIMEKNNLHDTLILKAYNNASIIYGEKADNSKSISMVQKAIGAAASMFGSDDPRLAKLYNNLGATYLDIGNTRDALKCFDKAERIFLLNYGRGFQNLSTLYSNEALIFKNAGDYEKSLHYLKSSLQVLEANPNMTDNPKGLVYCSMGMLYLVNDEYDKAIECLKMAMSIKNQKSNKYHFGFMAPNDFRIYTSLGRCYLGKKQYKEAKRYFEMATELDKKYRGESHPNTGDDYYYQGEMYGRSLNDIPKGIQYCKKALGNYMLNYGLHNPWTAECFSSLGELYEKEGNAKLAIEYCHKALIGITENYNDTNVLHNPAADLIQPNLNSLDRLIRLIKRKAWVLKMLYEEKQNIDFLIASFQTLELVSQLIDRTRLGYESEKSKLMLSSNEAVTYQELVDKAYQLYQLTGSNLYLDKAYEYTERNKAATLMSAIRDIKARQFSGIPPSMLNLEERLRKEISGYQGEIYEERKAQEPNVKKIKFLEANLLNSQLSYDSLIDRFEKKYPEYYRLKYQSAVATIRDVRHSLEKDEVLLEYLLTDSSIYIFTISPKYTSLTRERNDSLFASSLHAFLRNLAYPDFSGHTLENYKVFVHSGYTLFSKLLGPVYKEVRGKELLIVPDGRIAYLPFDVLLTNEKTARGIDYGSLPYLIRESLVSYNYSSTLMLSNKGHFHAYNRLLAAAPEYSSDSTASTLKTNTIFYRKNLFPLPGANEEVRLLSNYYPSRILTGSDATENNFKALAPHYNILHLAMHTIIENDNPMYSKLAFTNSHDSLSDDLMNTYELYNFKLNANLAVLSSCNSGNGMLSKGEGVMSLARGFIYAGCPSIVMSLWEIEDQSSVELMKAFYEQLSKGKKINSALRTSKLRFLQHADPLTAHPYFWSGYVSIGNISPIGIDRRIIRWIIIFAGISIVLLLLKRFLRFRSIRQNQGRT